MRHRQPYNRCVQDEFGRLREEEALAIDPALIIFGFGPELKRLAGKGLNHFGRVLANGLNTFRDHSLQRLRFTVEIEELGSTALYLRRRGRRLDVGTRADFAQLGMESDCDRLDQMEG